MEHSLVKALIYSAKLNYHKNHSAMKADDAIN